MSAFILLLLFIGTISATFKPEREFEVKQGGLLNHGGSYMLVLKFLCFIFIFNHLFRITEVSNLTDKISNPNRFTIQNELFSLGKKLVLLENQQPLYEIKHKLGHLYQK